MRYKYLFFTVFISGCAGFGQIEKIDNLTPEQMNRIHQVKIMPASYLANGSHTSLGRIKGLSCAADGQLVASEDEAQQQLLIKAAKLGANAISTPLCQANNRVDLGNNCWKSVVCISEAFVY